MHCSRREDLTIAVLQDFLPLVASLAILGFANAQHSGRRYRSEWAFYISLVLGPLWKSRCEYVTIAVF